MQTGVIYQDKNGQSHSQSETDRQTDREKRDRETQDLI